MDNYQKVYFRIETGYQWGLGHGEDENKRFNEELARIFPTIGFTMVTSNISSASKSAVRGKEELYCHPMDISGIIRIESISEIEQLLIDSNIELRGIDIYNEYVDAGEDFVRSELERRRPEIEEKIFKSCQTKRKDSFVTSYSGDIRIGILDESLENRIKQPFIQSVVQQMIEKNVLQTTKVNGRISYRSLNKTERKKWEKENGTLSYQ